MHILIIPSYLYRTEHFALGGVFQYHQANALITAGHRVGVLSAGLLPFKSVLKANHYAKVAAANEEGVAIVRRYDKALLPQRFISPAHQAKTMMRLGVAAFEQYVAQNGMPDIAHAHDCLYAGVLASELKKRFGLPYVVTEHSSAHGRNILNADHEKYIKTALTDADALTAVGSSTRDILQRKYKDFPVAAGITVIYNLLESTFEDIRLSDLAPRKAGSGGFTFINVANLIELKKHKNLIAAFARVLKTHPDARLHIGGAGPMREELDRTIAALDACGSINMLGYLKRPELIAQIAASDVFVLSSDIETFGVVLIEAMALGKPVISTASGGPQDIVDDACGYLVPVGSVDALAATMLKMMENIDSFNPDEIRRHCVERFGREAFITRLVGVYQGVLHKH